MSQPDAIVVGAGPNGLAAAVTLARAGLAVEIFERNSEPGGGARTAELTEPGFKHDVGSAVHPMALASPFFREFELEKRIAFALPEASYAHPLDGRRAGIAYRSLDRAIEQIGIDGKAWRSLFGPLIAHADEVMDFISEGLLHLPKRPGAAMILALRTLEQGTSVGRARFRGEIAPAMMAGLNAHSVGKIPSLVSAAAGLMLGAHGHLRGWPLPIGGSQSIVDAMVKDFVHHGGVIHTNMAITDLRELPKSKAVLLAVAARHAAQIGNAVWPDRYRRQLERFRYGGGIFKLDLATNAPIPWAVPEMAHAGTAHLGGTAEEIAAGERDIAQGREAKNPYILLSQPTLFDPSRAPIGKHIVWAYTHTPNGSTRDHTETVIAQIERFAPGFRDTIVSKASQNTEQLQAANPNLIGGDIAGGQLSLAQMLGRPIVSPAPWRTPVKGIYLCSASVAPGVGVHGLPGWTAARAALKDVFGFGGSPNLRSNTSR